MTDTREIVARRFGPAFERKCAIPTMKECAQWDCQKANRCKHTGSYQGILYNSQTEAKTDDLSR